MAKKLNRRRLPKKKKKWQHHHCHPLFTTTNMKVCSSPSFSSLLKSMVLLSSISATLADGSQTTSTTTIDESQIGVQIPGPIYPGGLKYSSETNTVYFTGSFYPSGDDATSTSGYTASDCYLGEINLSDMTTKIHGHSSTSEGSNGNNIPEACSALVLNEDATKAYVIGNTELGGLDTRTESSLPVVADDAGRGINRPDCISNNISDGSGGGGTNNGGCLIDGVQLNCPADTAFSCNDGQDETLLQAEIQCPLDFSVDLSHFVEASQQGLCQCNVTATAPATEDNRPIECDCFVCPEGSVFEYSYECNRPILSNCLTINCLGECNGNFHGGVVDTSEGDASIEVQPKQLGAVVEFLMLGEDNTPLADQSYLVGEGNVVTYPVAVAVEDNDENDDDTTTLYAASLVSNDGSTTNPDIETQDYPNLIPNGGLRRFGSNYILKLTKLNVIRGAIDSTEPNAVDRSFTTNDESSSVYPSGIAIVGDYVLIVGSTDGSGGDFPTNEEGLTTSSRGFIMRLDSSDVEQSEVQSAFLDSFPDEEISISQVCTDPNDNDAFFVVGSTVAPVTGIMSPFVAKMSASTLQTTWSVELLSTQSTSDEARRQKNFRMRRTEMTYNGMHEEGYTVADTPKNENEVKGSGFSMTHTFNGMHEDGYNLTGNQNSEIDEGEGGPTTNGSFNGMHEAEYNMNGNQNSEIHKGEGSFNTIDSFNGMHEEGFDGTSTESSGFFGDSPKTGASASGCVVDGNYIYVAGTVFEGAEMLSPDILPTQPFGMDDIFVAKLETSSSGQLQWARQVGTSRNDRLGPGGSIDVGSDSNILLLGQTEGALFEASMPEQRRRRKLQTTGVSDLVLFSVSPKGEFHSQTDQSEEPTDLIEDANGIVDVVAPIDDDTGTVVSGGTDDGGSNAVISDGDDIDADGDSNSSTVELVDDSEGPTPVPESTDPAESEFESTESVPEPTEPEAASAEVPNLTESVPQPVPELEPTPDAEPAPTEPVPALEREPTPAPVASPKGPKVDLSEMTKNLLIIILPVLIAVLALCACCFVCFRARKRAEDRAAQRQMLSIFKYLHVFDVDDIDIRRSPAGGYHGTYLNDLALGDSGDTHRKSVVERPNLSHASVVDDYMFMSKRTVDEDSDDDSQTAGLSSKL